MAHRAYYAISLSLDNKYQEEMILQALEDYLLMRYNICDPKVMFVGSLLQEDTNPISRKLLDVT